jgi:hypothetical protein
MNNRSASSNVDLATTVIFTDDPLVARVTTVKAAHLTELRIAVGAVRTLAALAPSTFTDPVLGSSMTIKAVHVRELRTALDDARSALMLLPALSYTDSTLATGAGATLVKAAHIQELRNGVK